MKTPDEEYFKKIADVIRRRFAIHRVLIFGSYARGMHGAGSDADLLVIMDTELKPYKQAALIRCALDEELSVSIPMDIIVREPKQISKSLKDGNSFFQTIMNEGISI